MNTFGSTLGVHVGLAGVQTATVPASALGSSDPRAPWVVKKAPCLRSNDEIDALVLKGSETSSPTTLTARKSVEPKPTASAFSIDSDGWGQALVSEIAAAGRLMSALAESTSSQLFVSYATRLRMVGERVPRKPDARATIAQLTQALAVVRTEVCDAANDYSTWVRVMRAIDPQGKVRRVPERFIRRVPAPQTELPTVLDLDRIRAVREFLGSGG